MVRHLTLEDEENQPSLSLQEQPKAVQKKSNNKQKEFDFSSEDQCFVEPEPKEKKLALKERNRKVSGGKKNVVAKKKKAETAPVDKKDIAPKEKPSEEPQNLVPKIKVPETKPKDTPR